MQYVELLQEENLALVTLNRGKVNALNDEVVSELTSCLDKLAADVSVAAVILTGKGKFFSFGFDIPHFMSYSREAFAEYLTSFSVLYTNVYLFPKPVIAALNGHAVAGGCMLANACDYRIMAEGKGKISLNEVTFGSSVFAGAVDILKALVGPRNAETILLGGSMYSAEQAEALGLIDRRVPEENLLSEAKKIAGDYGCLDGRAFASIKRLLRSELVERYKEREAASISEFVEIWYSEETRNQIKKIAIR
jgi:enoyl-CoA hydratase/carnithine racemase